MAHKVFISGSTQHENVGVGNYGTEEDRMQFFSDRVKYWLETQHGQFEVLRNKPGWTLDQTTESNNLAACELFIDNHTNAGSSAAKGTEVYYYGKGGTGSNSYKLATALYKRISPLSPGKDRGVLPDNSLYDTGLYVIQHTNCPSVLIELFFHTNLSEVDDYLKHIDDYAKQEAMAICDYFGIKWQACVSSGGIHVVVNGVDIDNKMDVKASIVNGRVLVPVRFLAQALGAQVSWNDKTKTVTVTKKE
jgi:N-acetylmuramoyl-L-alanine amidase